MAGRPAAAVSSYDVVIVGGGLVGASLAYALGSQPLRVAVVESTPLAAPGESGYDDRSLALAYGTRRVFEAMDLWTAVAPFATPIVEIQVSDRGHLGANRMSAAAYGFDALGYVVEARALGRLFAERLPALASIDWICPAKLISLDRKAGWIEAGIEGEGGGSQPIRARLLIGADGGQSAVRRLSGIAAQTIDYGQSAVIANVSPEQPHANRAYERFTGTGPLALLPMSANRCALVWTVPTARAGELLGLSDVDFLASLQSCFGNRLGRISRVGARSAHPLTLVTAKRHTAERLALIGNAAHTLHPVAGQGFNLGLRDVAALAEVISDAVRDGIDIGSAEVLGRYQQWRRRDQRRVVALTDGLIRVFSNGFGPVVVARNLGMLALDLIPPIKRAMMRQTMGLSGRLPRLARGLPL